MILTQHPKTPIETSFHSVFSSNATDFIGLPRNPFMNRMEVPR